jgi:hypothetical protein
MARLLVFLHLAVKQRALQGDLEAGLPGLTVTAVGRLGDVDRALSQGQDAVLALEPVLRARGLAPKLQGYRSGSADEVYTLVGVDAAPDPQRVQVVGTLDILGREGTTAFVHEVVGATPRVERVTKVEDLLPLLQMQRADSILLPVRQTADLRQMTQMNLAQSELPKRVGLPALAQLTPAGAAAAQGLLKLPPALLHGLGVDAWR